MRPRFFPFLIGAGLLFAGPASAHAAGLAMQEPNAHKTETIKYFLAHSLGFAPIFNLYHHSPGWILHRRKQLKLTKTQIAEERKLARGMEKHTGADIAILRKAYKMYSSDAARPDPPLSLIKTDVDRIGRDQTRLGFEMVPYHLKGYGILSPTQRATYAQLEAAFLKSLSLSMYANTSFAASPSASSH